MTVLGFLLFLAGQEASSAERIEFFEKKIRPVLVERCYRCHSADGDSVKGGLLLDTREALLKGGVGGPAIVPGDPEKSPLIRAIRHSDADFQMPPKSKLSSEDVANFEAWVRMGAPDPRGSARTTPRPSVNWAEARRFWSFRPLADADVPGNVVDHFIRVRLKEKNLRSAPPADRRTLIRRAAFDLTGLPPAPEEVDAFLQDDSPDAFARVVDRLLASPQYGVKWGRHWLDLVRYADTAGDSADYPVPQAHRYRDYVVDSFNKDKPYDQFLREQIAGDLLPSRDEAERRERIVATGFLAIARRFGEEPSADHHLTLDDTIDTLGRTVLGLTLSCARCHDHKFDPITTDDYYALYGILQSTRYPHAGSDKMKFQKDFVSLLPAGEAEAILKPFEEKLAAIDAEIQPLEAEVAAAEKELSGRKAEGPATAAKRSLQELRKELGELRKKREALAKQRPETEDAYAVAEGIPGPARIHRKGNPRNLGEEVPRRFLQILGGQELPATETGSGRRQLAEWLVDPRNPLTARVLVNRIWQHHFGKAIVPTPSYFGRQGLPPTHPELLDALAVEFLRSGWSIKAMHRLILGSRTWQQANEGDEENGRIDPLNDLLWKFPRRRLEAEAIRDAMLAVGGGLDPAIGRGHPFPARSTWAFSKASPFYAVYPTDRRSLYLMQQRLKKHPYLALFDGPDANASTSVRSFTTTSIQALFIMNSPFLEDQAKRFGERIRAARADDRERIDWAHQAAFGRPATEGERTRGLAFVEAHGWTSLARVLLSCNEFIFVD
jgi:uncharacterized protein DUF1549/uncharacterized protein DUF1553/cytochrome c